MAVAFFMFSACSDDDVSRDPSPLVDANSNNVSFTTDGNVVIGVDATEFTVNVTREKTESALTVNIKSYDYNEAGTFEIPTSVTFAAGEAEASFNVKVLKQLTIFESYKLVLEVDASQANPYVEQSSYPRTEMYIIREDYVPYAEGTYSSDFFGASWDQTLEYSPSTEVYRFKALWGYSGYDVTFTLDGSTVSMYGGTSSGNYTVFVTGYEDSDYGMISAYYSGCTYDDGSQTFTFPIRWVVSAGSYGTYNEYYTITSVVYAGK